MWEQCIPNELYTFIRLDENCKSLSTIDNTFQNSNAIVKKFIENGGNLDKLQKYWVMYQYIYSLLFPRCYTQNNKFGVQNKVSFTLHFIEWKDSKSVFPTVAVVTKEIVTNDLTKPDTA